MCKTFDRLYDRYISGVTAGALADNCMTALDPMSAEHREHTYYREQAYTRVKLARKLMERHRKTCGECRLATAFRTISRSRVDDVDPREFEQPPMIEMWEAR